MIDLIGIGKRVKTARTEHKLTREKLAEIVNVTPHYIYEIKRGMKAMSLETLANISSALELSSDYILFRKYHNPDDSVFAMLEELSEEKRLRTERAFAALLPYLKQKWGREVPLFFMRFVLHSMHLRNTPRSTTFIGALCVTLMRNCT